VERRNEMLKNVKAHATVPVADLARAKAFYIGVLGFDDLETDTDSGAMVNAGGGTRFALFVTPNTQRGGHTQLGFAVDDIEAEVADLKARGVVFEEYDMPGFTTVNSIVDSPPNRAAWFLDPDGNIVGLLQLGTP
jgi:catechol 2,3-dioxygenase-like lactoylglutathione lyase family enzyme